MLRHFHFGSISNNIFSCELSWNIRDPNLNWSCIVLIYWKGGTPYWMCYDKWNTERNLQLTWLLGKHRGLGTFGHKFIHDTNIGWFPKLLPVNIF